MITITRDEQQQQKERLEHPDPNDFDNNRDTIYRSPAINRKKSKGSSTETNRIQ